MHYLIIEKNMQDIAFIQNIREQYSDLKLLSKYEAKDGGWNSLFEKLTKFWKNYFLLSINALSSSGPNDTIITWQVFVGVITGIIIKVFGINRRLIILSFIYRTRKNKFINYIRFIIIKYGLSAAEKVICYSSYEAMHYANLFDLKKTKFVFIQLGKTYEYFKRINSCNRIDYIFSAGQSNRDFKTLFDSFQSVNANLIIASTSNILIPPELSDKISILQLTGNSFQEKLSNAKLVVITLNDVEYSSGQIVLINAMAYGKCVIITEANWTKDYLTHGENAWLVPPKDSKALAEAIRYISINDNIRKKIGDNAREYYKQNLSGEAFANRLIKIIEV